MARKYADLGASIAVSWLFGKPRRSSKLLHVVRVSPIKSIELHTLAGLAGPRQSRHHWGMKGIEGRISDRRDVQTVSLQLALRAYEEPFRKSGTWRRDACDPGPSK